MPTPHEIKNGNGDDGRAGKRGHDSPEDLLFMSSVHPSRVVQILGKGEHELAHQEDEEGIAQKGRHDQRRESFQPAPVAVDDEEWNEAHLRRQHHGGNHDNEDYVPSRPFNAGKAVAYEDIGKHRPGHDAEGKNEGVAQIAQEANGGDGFRVVAEYNVLWNQPHWDVEDVGVGFQGRTDHPQEWQHEDQAENNQGRVGRDPLQDVAVINVAAGPWAVGCQNAHAARDLPFVRDPVAGAIKHQKCQRQNYNEQHPGHGGGKAHLQIFKGHSVQLIAKEQRGLVGATSCHDFGGRNGLKGKDGHGDDIEEHLRGEQGQGDSPHLAPGIGAINVRRFI